MGKPLGAPFRLMDPLNIGGGLVLIKINGLDSEVADDITIQEVVLTSDFKDSLIVVQLNGTVTRRESWATPLKAHDRLEIVRVIGGG
jgi:thiamine biosynthesis protein ThiS